MALSSELDPLIKKTAEPKKGVALIGRVGVARELMEHSLVKGTTERIAALTLSDIINNEDHSQHFGYLLESHRTTLTATPEDLVQKLSDNTLTNPERAELVGLVETFKERILVAETVTQTIDRDMLSHIQLFSDDFSALFPPHTNDVGPLIGVLHEGIWRNAMGSTTEYARIKNLAEKLNEVKKMNDSPERAHAKKVLAQRLEKHGIQYDQFQGIFDPKDVAGSTKRLRELITDKSYKNNWKKWLNTFDYAGQQAKDIVALANDPARGGLAAANESIANQIKEVGTFAAAELGTDPWVHAQVHRVILQEEAAPAKGILPAQHTEGFQTELRPHIDAPTMWDEWEDYAINSEDNKWLDASGALVTFDQLGDPEKQAYIDDFAAKKRANFIEATQERGFFGFLMRALGMKDHATFTSELKAHLGNRPLDV